VPAALAGGTPVAYELANKVTLGETSEQGPALAGSMNLLLGWKGAGNDTLNIIRFGLGSYNVEHKTVFDEFSDRGPALTGHKLYLLMGWKGSGNENLNVALAYP
jgi:hypothetical protein